MSTIRANSVFSWIDRHFVLVTAVFLIGSLAVAAVGLTTRDDTEPSFDPDDEIYDIANRADEVFESSSTIRSASFLVDREDGTDVLTRDGLLPLVELSRSALADPTNQQHLTDLFDRNLGLTIDGVTSVATAVDDTLPGGLAAAGDDDVKLALASVLASDAPTGGLRFTLAQAATSETAEIDGQPTTIWRSPAYQVEVRYDLASFRDEIAVDTADVADVDAALHRAGEQWLRELQAKLQPEEGPVRVIGIGIDALLTGEEQFTAGGPFIFLAVGLIVILVGVLMRSYWAGAAVASMLGATLLFYNGVLGVIGIKMTSQLILFVVPITLIAFGVDFFVHAAGRVREAALDGPPQSVYRTGLVAVLPALTLAAATSIAAFLSNVASGIEAIVQFGVAAAVGLVISYVALGWLAPRAMVGLERLAGHGRQRQPNLRRRAGVTVAFLLMAGVAGAVVTLAALAPAVGLVGVPAFLAVFVAAPVAFARRRQRTRRNAETATVTAAGGGHGSKSVGRAVHMAARWRYPTLAAFAALGVVSLLGAIRVDSAFEVSDFFSRKTDFIVGLDRLEQYYGDTVGGTAYIYLEGDLTEPSTIVAIEDTVAGLAATDAAFARDLDGTLIVTPNVVDVVRTMMALPAAAAEVGTNAGLAITDADGDGLPDDPAAIEAIYSHARTNGVVAGDGTVVFTPEQIESILFVDGDTQATRIEVLVTTFTDDAVIIDARNTLDAAAERLSVTLGSTVPTVTVSGDVIASQDSLAAFTRAMVVSLPIAVAVTVLIVGLAIRSVRYSVVTIMPILLVVFGVWGYMWARGFTVNVVTATIAAIAVGVGIDFCTHFTVRFREELMVVQDRFLAVRRAGEGTGGALAISALTSIAGFGVMTAAPAPIFASFGELMAVMILLSAVVALFVLPCLLVMVTRPTDVTEPTEPPTGTDRRDPLTTESNPPPEVPAPAPAV